MLLNYFLPTAYFQQPLVVISEYLSIFEHSPVLIFIFIILAFIVLIQIIRCIELAIRSRLENKELQQKRSILELEQKISVANRLQASLEERDFEQKNVLAKLEQELAQSKLNPHFVYNCLNGILTFIYAKEYEKVKHYLPRFSRLIRSSIELSKNNFVDLQTEICYLDDYLALESMRFPEDFRYKIQLDDALATDIPFLPTLMIQIFVENALVHGIMGLDKSKKGEIIIRFYPISEYRVGCQVIDNGVGHKQAACNKENEAKNLTSYVEKKYSLGLDMTFKRIKLLEQLFDVKIELDISENLEEESGTIVTLSFPLLNKENNPFRQ